MERQSCRANVNGYFADIYPTAYDLYKSVLDDFGLVISSDRCLCTSDNVHCLGNHCRWPSSEEPKNNRFPYPCMMDICLCRCSFRISSLPFFPSLFGKRLKIGHCIADCLCRLPSWWSMKKRVSSLAKRGEKAFCSFCFLCFSGFLVPGVMATVYCRIMLREASMRRKMKSNRVKPHSEEPP